MADLPRGTVTFLFTDIEGSTALWERDRTAMAIAVAAISPLLHAAIEAMAACSSRQSAMRSRPPSPPPPMRSPPPLLAQRALQAEPWSPAASPPPSDALQRDAAVHR